MLICVSADSRTEYKQKMNRIRPLFQTHLKRERCLSTEARRSALTVYRIPRRTVPEGKFILFAVCSQFVHLVSLGVLLLYQFVV